MQINKAYVHFC